MSGMHAFSFSLPVIHNTHLFLESCLTAALARPPPVAAVDAMRVRWPRPVVEEGKRRDERETPGSKALLPATPPRHRQAMHVVAFIKRTQAAAKRVVVTRTLLLLLLLLEAPRTRLVIWEGKAKRGFWTGRTTQRHPPQQSHL